MDRMKSFFVYFLLFVGMFIVFNLLENGLTASMFSEVKGTTAGNDKMSIEVSDSKASNVNGYMDIKITNDSDEYIDEAYAKVDLIDEYGMVAATEYITVEDLAPGESKTYKVKYNGNSIKGYNVGVVDEIPDKSNIINILGWEIDKTDAFGTGVDLTKVKVLGMNVGDKLSEIFGGAKKYGKAGWRYFLSVARFIPPWAYVVASIIVLWYI